MTILSSVRCYTILTDSFAGRRSLGVNLLYNSDCPHSYEPSGFVESTNFQSFNPGESCSVGEFDAGPYRVAVAASHRSSAAHYNEDMEASKQLQAMQRSSSLPSNLISTQSEQVRLAGAPQCLRGSSILSQPEAVTPARTPGSLQSGTPHIRGTGLVTDWKSRRQRNIMPSKMAELIVHAWGIEIHNEGLRHLLDIDQLKGNNIQRLNPGRNIRCECGSEHKEDTMVGLRSMPWWRVLPEQAVIYGIGID